jgi:alpha-D-ribose 1-methylphosphonate 5-phosphate C-P lyase
MDQTTIELTEHQIAVVQAKAPAPTHVVNPRTQETFVLLSVDEYRRLKAIDYDDSPWTREEMEALAWETGKAAGWDEMDEYDNLPQ